MRATRVLCAGVPSPVTLSCTLWPVWTSVAAREEHCPTRTYYTLPHRAAGPAAADRTRTECCGIGRECRPRCPTDLVSERLGVCAESRTRTRNPDS